MFYNKIVLINLLLLGGFFSQAFSQSTIDVGLGMSNTHISMKNSSLNIQHMWNQDFSINYYRAYNSKILYNLGLHYQTNSFAIQMQNGTLHDYNLGYFRIPVSIGYVAINNKFNLNIIGGPYIGFLINAKETIYVRSTMGGDIINYDKNNIRENFNNVDYGLQIGIKLGLNNGLSLNGKYWYSINKFKYSLMNNENISFMTIGISYNIKKLFNTI